jgi:hypothetical protein
MMFIGEYDMQMTTLSNPVACEAVRGRTCHNCGGWLRKFLVIPTQKELVAICHVCLNHIMGLEDPEETVPPINDIALAVQTLNSILEDTSA